MDRAEVGRCIDRVICAAFAVLRHGHDRFGFKLLGRAERGGLSPGGGAYGDPYMVIACLRRNGSLCEIFGINSIAAPGIAGTHAGDG